MPREPLRVHRGGAAPVAPPTRGRLLSARQIIARHFADLDRPPSEAWIREHVPHKVRLSHKRVCWYETDVDAWLNDRRGAA